MEQTSNQESTYLPTSLVEADIREMHRRLITSLNIKTEEAFRDVPNIYGIPKMHKNPIKFRFITGAKNSTLKPLTIILQRILSHFRKHFSNYCNVIKQRTGVKHFWSIDNSMKVFNDSLVVDNDTQVFSADFTSLFTNLPHQIVKENIRKLVTLCMRGYNYVRVNQDKVSYATTDTGKGNYFKKEDIFYRERQSRLPSS